MLAENRIKKIRQQIHFCEIFKAMKKKKFSRKRNFSDKLSFEKFLLKLVENF